MLPIPPMLLSITLPPPLPFHLVSLFPPPRIPPQPMEDFSLATQIRKQIYRGHKLAQASSMSCHQLIATLPRQQQRSPDWDLTTSSSSRFIEAGGRIPCCTSVGLSSHIEERKTVPEQSKKEDSSRRNGCGGPSMHSHVQTIQKNPSVYNRWLTNCTMYHK
jgi:hypothetical protein